MVWDIELKPEDGDLATKSMGLSKSVAARARQGGQCTLHTMAESATPVKLFGKWSLEDVEVSDLALVVRSKTLKIDQGDGKF